MIISKIKKYFLWQKIKKSERIQGWLTKNESIELFNISRMLPHNSTVIEIGCWKGKSSYCITSGLKSGSKLFVIDPFDCSGDIESNIIYNENISNKSLLDDFKVNLSDNDLLNKVEILQGLSNDFVGKVNDVDFLFIDGDHSIESCSFDFENYSNSVKPGGYIALHDFDPNREELGPTWVVNNLISKNNSFQFNKIVDSLWICKKLNV